jgi:hypothetical protein
MVSDYVRIFLFFKTGGRMKITMKDGRRIDVMPSAKEGQALEMP